MRLLVFLLLALTLPLSAAEPIKIACMGDSLTAGATAPPAAAYPKVLGDLLGAGYEVKNFGKGGATLWHGGRPNAFEQLPGVTTFAPSLIVIMFGTNDTRSRDAKYWSHFDEF